MRLHHVLVNVAAGMLALVVSFALLSWQDDVPGHPLTRNRGVPGQTSSRSGDQPATPALDPDTQCQNADLKMALSSLGRAVASGPTEIKMPVPQQLNELARLGLRYTNVNSVERSARNLSRERVMRLCQDSLGDKHLMRLTYDVRLQGRKAAFDLTSKVVEQGAPASAELIRCIETVASRIDVDVPRGYADLRAQQIATDRLRQHPGHRKVTDCARRAPAPAAPPGSTEEKWPGSLDSADQPHSL
jgi:hypothetical protein